MGTRDEVLVRIDEIEGELRDLSRELHELRSIVRQAAAVPVAQEPTAVPQATRERVASRPAPAPGPTGARARAAIFNARILLSDGRHADALDELEAAVAVSHFNPEELELLAVELEGIARYRPRVRDRALTIAGYARTAEIPAQPEHPPAPAPPAQPALHVSAAAPATATPPARVAPPAPPAAAPAPPAPPRRGLGDLARDWDLLGPRGFAIVGGAVTALGIILLFVLAANRGWIDPVRRVAIGAAVSAAAVGVGFWVRSRYGQMQMSLGAVGAGIAGGYATLAAAAARYDLVPDWLALPLAGLIAAVAVVIAIAWSSEIVAAIGLAGAAMAPALEAIDTGMTWPAAAFAVIVLAATVVLTVPRRWHLLLVGIAGIVTAQVGWLAHASEMAAAAGTTAVVAALVLVVLAAGIALQLASDKAELDQLATSFALAAVGLALVLVRQLYEVADDRGIALAGAAAVWALAWALLYRRQPALGLVLGVSALTLAAVASANLLSGTSLAVTWAAESVLLSWLAWRLRDARLQATALAYGALACVQVLVLDAPPSVIFVDPVAGIAAVSVAALAVAALAAGLLAPVDTVVRTETGLLSWLAVVRTKLGAHRDGIGQGLVLGGIAAGTYAAALALVSISFRPGHLAATIVAATVGAAVTAISARLGAIRLVALSFGWLAGVMVVAAMFDVPEFGVEAIQRSYGGWALFAAAAGVLAGGFAYQVLFPDPGSPAVPAVTCVTALAASAAGIALLSPAGDVLESSWIGWRLLAPAAVYVILSASVFRVARHRDLATVMWSLAAAALLGSEWLVVGDPNWRGLAFAVTAAGLAVLARPLRELRLWFAGWSLALGTAIGAVLWLAGPMSLVDMPDQSIFARDEVVPSAWQALGTFAAAAALLVVAAVAWHDRARRDFVTWAWAIGIVALLDAEAFVIQDGTWIAAAFAATAVVVAALERLLGELRLWFAGWSVASGVATVTMIVLGGIWMSDGAEPTRYAIAAFSVAASLAAVCALAWGMPARRDLSTTAWACAIVSLILGEAFLLGGAAAAAFAAALTGGAVAVLATPLREDRLWWAGALVVSVTSAAVLVLLMPPSHFLTASASPGEALWVAIGCLVAGVSLHLTGAAYRRWIDPIVAVGALYALSLGILELAERTFAGSVEADFERGHVAVSSVWALIGLALLVAGLIRGDSLLRFGGLALFGLSLAKIFLYDLSALSSVARAFSFIMVGALVLAGGFFLQRLSSQMGPRPPRTL